MISSFISTVSENEIVRVAVSSNVQDRIDGGVFIKSFVKSSIAPPPGTHEIKKSKNKSKNGIFFILI